MPDEPKSTKSLEYDRTTTVVSVRGFRTLVLLTLINTAMLGWFVITGSQGPQLVQQQWKQWQAKRIVRKAEAALLAQQRQCLAHAAPDGTVVYTEDPQRIAALSKGDGQYRSIHADNVTVADWRAPLKLAAPAYWTTFRDPSPVTHGFSVTSKDPAVAFLHERQTPKGERLLVVVQIDARQAFDQHSSGIDDVQPLRQLYARAYSLLAPGKAATLVAQTVMELRLPGRDRLQVRRATDGTYAVARGPALTLFAGQPDPADPAHFTIPYEIDGQPGMIDGWLRASEVVMKARSATAKFDAGPHVWELGVSATTAPATAPLGP